MWVEDLGFGIGQVGCLAGFRVWVEDLGFGIGQVGDLAAYDFAINKRQTLNAKP